MLTFRQKKIIYFLKKSFENEEFLDQFFKNSNFRASKVSYNLPRFQKRNIFYAKYGQTYLVLEFIFILAYPIFVFFFIIFYLTKAFFISVFKKKPIDKNYDDVFFINGEISEQLYLKYIGSKFNSTTLNLNRRGLSFKSPDVVYLSHFSFADFLESCKIFLAFIFKFKFHFKISFLAIDWLIIFFTLRRIPFNNIHSFDHYDRFAICIDCIAYFGRSKNVRYFFHQHGDFSNSNKFSLPYKLNFVTYAFLKDAQNSLMIFQSKILNKPLELIHISFNTEDFTLTCFPYDLHFKILIIGNGYCVKFHENLINSLFQSKELLNFTIYYKAHPNDNLTPIIQNDSLVFVEKNVYPNVDLVFSYDSTLLFKYINSGFDYILHDLNSNNVFLYQELILKKISLKYES